MLLSFFKSPYQILLGTISLYSSLRVFGCLSLAKNLNIQHKFDELAKLSTFCWLSVWSNGILQIWFQNSSNLCFLWCRISWVNFFISWSFISTVKKFNYHYSNRWRWNIWLLHHTIDCFHWFFFWGILSLIISLIFQWFSSAYSHTFSIW